MITVRCAEECGRGCGVLILKSDGGGAALDGGGDAVSVFKSAIRCWGVAGVWFSTRAAVVLIEGWSEWTVAITGV